MDHKVNLDIKNFGEVERFLTNLKARLSENNNYQLSDEERGHFFQIKKEYYAQGSKNKINILLKELTKLETNGIRISEANSLTDEIQEFLVNFLHHSDEDLKRSLKRDIDKIFDKLDDQKIKNDEDLKNAIQEILSKFEDIESEKSVEFKKDLQNLLNKNRELSKDRIADQNNRQNSILDDYFSINLNQRAGTSKIRSVIKKIRFLGDGKDSDEPEYRKIFLVKENIIDKNDKGLLVGVMNQEKFQEITRKYPIRKFTFIFSEWMEYVQNLYNNYAHNSSNEELISKFLKIYDEESSYEIKKIKYNDGSGADITLVEFVDKVKPIYQTNEKEFDKFSVKRSFIQMYDGDLNKYDESSLFKAFQIAFFLGISDRINSGNFLEKTIDGQEKTKVLNIDFGQLFDFQHNLTVKKFCDCIQSGKIDKAKKVFLNTWKEELARKLFMRKTAQARPFLFGGIFFEEKRNQLSELRLEIKKFNQIYSTLERFVEKMPNEDFKKSFEFLCDKSKLNDATQTWNNYYKESGKYQVNSSGKPIRYNIAQGLSELNKAFSIKIENKKNIAGRVKYWEENYFFTKFFISLAMNVASIAAAKIIFDNFDKIKDFYQSTNESKMIVRVLLAAFILISVISVLSTIYFGVKKSEMVSEIFENGYVGEIHKSQALLIE